MMYAQTQNSFEEIALKFIKLDGKDALKSFIQKKLSALRPQVTFINFAKLEIYRCRSLCSMYAIAQRLKDDNK